MSLPNASAAPLLGDFTRNEAVALFVQRATAVDPTFTLNSENGPQVAEIVTRVDGLPLAIELAAMRVGVLRPAAMLRRMDRRLPLLNRGGRDLPARQQTLRAAIGWSYDLLEGKERVLFRRLSTMIGGATLEAAGAVCDPNGAMGLDILEVISGLTDSSLVHTTKAEAADVRFGMLQTVREFAHEQLEAEGERFATERLHAGWFLDLAEAAELHFRGPEIGRWMETMQLEHDNLRAAIRWAIASSEAEIGLRIVGALWRFWHLGGHLSEGRRWAETVLLLPSAGTRSVERAKALAALGGLAYWQNDVPAARDAYEEALGISRELEDEPGIAEGTYNLAFAYGLVPTGVGSRDLFVTSRVLFDRLGNRRGVADSLWALALLTRLKGEHVIARQLAEESTRLHRELGDAVGLIDSLEVLGRAAFEMGDIETARSSYLETLDILGPIGYRTALAIVLDNLAAHENRRGQQERALRLGGAAEALKEAAGGQVPPEFADLPDLREAARATMSEDRIGSVWEEGRAMTLVEAMAYARAEPELKL